MEADDMTEDRASPHSPTADHERTTAAGPPSTGLACNSCRKAKLKCSRDRPACQYCRKVGSDCIYETKRVKPGLKVGAIDHIHKRLDDLERRLGEREARANGSRNTISTSAQERSDDYGFDESPAFKILSRLAAELPKLVDVSRTGSSEQLPPRKRRLVDDVISPVAPQDEFHVSALPSVEVLEPVMGAYFEHVHPWIPMIHQGRFRQRLGNPAEAGKLTIILHAMTIAAARFVADDDAMQMHHAFPRSKMENVKRWVVSTAMENLSLEGLQALIIIAFNDIGCGNGHKAWSLIGSLSRTVEYTQLSIEQEETVASPRQPLCFPAISLTPSQSWTEAEERRRVFWNVFNLDRFCSTSMGWNTSLTSDDVYRRLPCDGRLWREEQPVRTPYFGIWDKSAGRIGNPIHVGPSSYPSPSASSAPIEDGEAAKTTDMSRVGAFAYCIEATESMSRVSSYFLHQKINFNDASEVSQWLTRFKELDLRLVHWKMLLPNKWKNHMAKQTISMDPNLTIAHVTHNASTIMLHQPVAYPNVLWTFRRRLPSGWSAETCCSAAVEIATIAQNYLRHTRVPLPVASQLAFCLLVAARVLLVHWRYDASNALLPEFWSLVDSLEEMGRRWAGTSPTGGALDRDNLAFKYSSGLRELQRRCLTDEGFTLDVKDYCSYEVTSPPNAGYRQSEVLPAPQQPEVAPESASYQIPTLPNTYTLNGPETVQVDAGGPTVVVETAPHMDVGSVSGLGGVSMEFTTTPPMLLDSNFMEMERVISFDDGSMFTTTFEPTGW